MRPGIGRCCANQPNWSESSWRILVKVLRARYGIPLDRVYAHNWIDFKDARYCEGCALATMAREWGE